MKNIFLKILTIYFVLITNIYANWPKVVCNWLPWCSTDSVWEDALDSVWEKGFFDFIWKTISEWIKYVAVVAVISLMISWIMYLMSGWEEDKVKKAKSWIIWSLVWVFLSISAWAIINLLNQFKIN